jgi:membrane protein DedA with SNARE-associated domain
MIGEAMDITEVLQELVGDQNSLVGLSVLAGSAAIEYVFPPFPGDLVTILGAVLVTGYGWSFFAVLGAVMLGSVLGAYAAFEIGVIWARRRAANPLAKPHPRLDAVVARFKRHGSAYVVINRFVPGIRGLIFVAAGLADLPRRSVLFYAALSALLWNLALMGLGVALGANLDALRTWVERYTIAAWIALVVVAIVIVVAMRRKRTDTPAG